jgi:hypothetical protein
MDRDLKVTDIQSWANTAPPELVIEAAHKLLDKVADYTDENRERFSSGVSQQGRKLFEGQPVG